VGRKEFRRPCEASIRRWWTKSGARPRSLGRPFPLLAESRLHAAHGAAAEWLAALEGEESERVVEAAGPAGHPTLAAYIISVFYGEGAEECDEHVRAGLVLMLRTLTDALDLGEVEA